MKKIFSILMVVAMMFACLAVASCGNNENNDKEIVMITDIGDIDDESFNQGTWTGVEEWAKANGKSYEYIKPTSSNEADLLSAIDLAVENYNAKVIVCPGFVFATPIWKAQKTYTDVKFVILDSGLNNADYSDFTVNANVACFTYEAEISGYLAGYAAVKEGMTNLAYLGGIGYNTVYCFGVGFAQGAEKAAEEMSLADGAIKLTWDYTGNFDDTPDNKAKAAALFSNGVECIFSVGGKNQKSCFQAASEATGNKWVISPDTDSTKLSDKCLTSALKELATTVKLALDDIYKNNGAKYLGKVNALSITDGAVGLCGEFGRFKTFTKADYDAIYAQILAGTIKVQMPAADYSENAAGQQNLGGIDYKKVSFTFVSKTAE